MAVTECNYFDNGGGVNISGNLHEIFVGVRNGASNADTQYYKRVSGTYWTGTDSALDFTGDYIKSTRSGNSLVLTAVASCTVFVSIDDTVEVKAVSANDSIGTWNFYGDTQANMAILAYA